MSEITDAQRLLARGITVELADGATHEFRFPARTLARIEADYGSLEAFTEAMTAKPFTTLAYVLHVTLGVPKDRAIDLIVTRRTREYIDAIGAALEEALPPMEAGDQGNAKAAPDSSPGAAFSVSPSSVGISTPSASGI